MLARNALLIALLGSTLAACATEPPLAPRLSETSFKPATRLRDPAPIKLAPLPLPVPKIDLSKLMDIKPVQIPPLARVKAANSEALHEPETDSFIDAVQVYPYSADALYRLYAAPLQVTDIALQPGETLSAISAGDTVRWAIGNTTTGQGKTARVHVLVKPFHAGLQTNLVILTDRHTYHLELVSTDKTAMAAISWSYPSDDLIDVKARKDELAAPVDSGVTLGKLNFDYRITGDNPPWRPMRAFDDGRHVYIEFPKDFASTDAPPLFVMGEGGESDLVNYRVKGRYYVVDKLFRAAELRLGKDDQKIVRIIRDTPSGS